MREESTLSGNLTSPVPGDPEGAGNQVDLALRSGIQSGGEYWEKRLRQFPGLEGVGYIGLGTDFNQWQYKLRRKVFLRHVAASGLDFRTASVLDVGSGTGFWLEVWRSLGVRELAGSDITNFAVENLRSRFPGVRLRRLDLTVPGALDEFQSGCDAVTAMDMLYHLVSDEGYLRALTNLSGAVKLGGYLIFTENLVHREMPRSPSQANRTIQMVTDALRNRGLRIIQRAPVFVAMNNPIDAASETPSRIWRAVMAPVRRFPAAGGIYGAILYPLDLLLTRLLREGPSTELVICKKYSA